MKDTFKAVQAGFPLGSILVIIFVLAKLFGVISWSWLWVFSPLWIPTAVFLSAFAVALVVLAVVAVIVAAFD